MGVTWTESRKVFTVFSWSMNLNTFSRSSLALLILALPWSLSKTSLDSSARVRAALILFIFWLCSSTFLTTRLLVCNCYIYFSPNLAVSRTFWSCFLRFELNWLWGFFCPVLMLYSDCLEESKLLFFDDDRLILSFIWLLLAFGRTAWEAETLD